MTVNPPWKTSRYTLPPTALNFTGRPPVDPLVESVQATGESKPAEVTSAYDPSSGGVANVTVAVQVAGSDSVAAGAEITLPPSLGVAPESNVYAKSPDAT